MRRYVVEVLLQNDALTVATDEARAEVDQALEPGELPAERDHVADAVDVDGLQQGRSRRGRLDAGEVEDMGRVGEALDLEPGEAKVHLADVADGEADAGPIGRRESLEVGIGVGAPRLLDETHRGGFDVAGQQTSQQALGDEAGESGQEDSYAAASIGGGPGTGPWWRGARHRRRCYRTHAARPKHGCVWALV